MRREIEGNTGYPDRVVLLAALTLLAFGVLMVFSATAVVAENSTGSSAFYLKKHLFHVIAGLGVLWLSMRVDLAKLERLAPWLLLGVFLLLSIVLIPQIGMSAGGARRWLGFGPLRFQPGELSKLAVVIYISAYISRYFEGMHRFSFGVLLPLSVVVALDALLLMQPDFGTSAILLGVVCFQLLLASRISHLVTIACVAGGAVVALIASSPYRLRRVRAFLDPMADPSNESYQLVQSLIAVGSGGLTGQGLGAGEQKLFYLPAAHTDFIFAVVGEELGIVGALLVVSLFALVALRGVIIARAVFERPFLAALAIGSTMIVVLPAMLNFGVVLGLLPTKGLVLPLVAYGGTAMVVNLTAIGLLLNVSRYAKEEE